MAKIAVTKGATSKLVSVFVQDSSSTTGAGLAGLVFNSASLTAYYYREAAGSAVAISLVTMTLGTWVSGGFKEIDATNMPGWYSIGLPDAALAAGANSVGIHLKGATNMAPLPLEIQLDEPTNADSGTAQAGAAGTITLRAGASATDNLYRREMVRLTGGTGAGQARVATGYVGSTKVLTVDENWITNPDNTTTYVITNTSNPKLNSSQEVVAASVTGAVGSVTSGVTVATNNDKTGYTASTVSDKTGYALSGAGVTAVQSGLATSSALATVQLDTDDIQTRLPAALVSGRIDASVGAYPGNTPQTGDNFARLGAPVGATISADIAGVQADTDNLQTRIPAALVSGRIDASVGAMATDTLTSGALAATAVSEIQSGLGTSANQTTILANIATVQADTDDIQSRLPAALVSGKINAVADSLGATAKADVNAEILDVLDVDTNTEITSIPSATTTLRGMIKTLFAFCTNKLTETATTQTLRNRADGATIGTATTSDDATTATRGSFS